MKKIVHWTIKMTWETDNPNIVKEEYINDVPNWVAEVVEEFLDLIEEERNNDE